MDIPHTLVFGLIMYSMVCKTTGYVRYSQSCCEYRYQSDQSTDHGTTVKNVMSTKVALMTCFLASKDYEVLVVSDYIDTVFINAPCDF